MCVFACVCMHSFLHSCMHMCMHTPSSRLPPVPVAERLLANAQPGISEERSLKIDIPNRGSELSQEFGALHGGTSPAAAAAVAALRQRGAVAVGAAAARCRWAGP